MLRTADLPIRSLLSQGRTSQSSVEYPKVTGFTNSAATVAELALKPESNMTVSMEAAQVRTIAHWIAASKQVMDDTPMLESLIDTQLLNGLALVEDAQLLLGDGTGQNLHGILPQHMEEVRALLGGRPIVVTSGYRSEAVNRLVGGSKTSAHMTGHAVDFTCPGFGTPAQIAAHLARHLKGFDQIIEEFGQWVHIGFGPGQRGQKLTARKVAGRIVYKPGIADA